MVDVLPAATPGAVNGLPLLTHENVYPAVTAAPPAMIVSSMVAAS